ncbi:hypothetical protein [Roseinatronobacter sp. NSM]|uniref:hypothetical protein n=1 Tax=Roseinatronobacter sp. NSM TaxID=3457785 RepID=UPI0040352318
MPESKPARAFDELLAQHQIAELTHRAQEHEMAAAILIVAARIIGAAALEDDASFEQNLARFRTDARFARSQMRATMQAKAMIDRARGGGYAH